MKKESYSPLFSLIGIKNPIFSEFYLFSNDQSIFSCKNEMHWKNALFLRVQSINITDKAAFQ